MNTALAPLDRTDSPAWRDRLWATAEQLRLTAVALNTMARAATDDRAIAAHIDRLEHRAAELMRSTERLGEALGLAESWGIDVLFQPAEAAPSKAAPGRPPLGPTRRKHRAVPAAGVAESIELTPFDLLPREIPPTERRPRPTRALPPPIPAPLGAGEEEVTVFDFDRV
ncbi:MAG: hypothetical protein R3F65_12960 [bacterium]